MQYTIYDGSRNDRTNWKADTFLAVNSCGVHVESKVRTIREKGRVDWHLLYVQNGEMQAVVNGKEMQIAQGGFLIYPPDVRQEYWQISGMCYWVHFSGLCAEEVLQMVKLKISEVQETKLKKNPIASCFEKMIFDEAVQSEVREAVLCRDLMDLLVRLGQCCISGEMSCADERLMQGMIHMNSHYDEKINLDFYAELAGLSKGRYMHVFKNATGLSPYAYVLRLRFERAALLLRETELSVTEISELIGTEDVLYFSRMFRKYYGISPEKYRKMQSEGKG